MTCRDLVTQCRDMLEGATRRAEAARPMFDEDAWNRAPQGGWSPAQIFEHLTLANAPYLAVLPPAIEQAPSGDEAPVKHTFLGRMIYKMSGPSGNAPPPKPMVPRPGPYGDEPFQRWLEQQRTISAQLDRAEGKNLSAVKVRNPYLRLLKMTLCDFVAILATHTDRHIGQIEERAGL